VVDSPPGVGKSTLVVRAAAELAAAGERVMIADQTNEPVDDLASRLAAGHPALPVGRLIARDYALPGGSRGTRTSRPPRASPTCPNAPWCSAPRPSGQP
jgi:hypothetical protein